MITKGIKELCKAAEKEIETLSVNQVLSLYKNSNILLIDVRDIRELWINGKIPNARHVPRGMLEFWADPKSPYHRKFFNQDKKFIFYCAGGMRSALSALTIKNMGINQVAHIAGGFDKWLSKSAPIERVICNIDKYK